MAGTRATSVRILTFEGPHHWEQTLAGMLTQFFLDTCNINTAVSTYVVHNTLHTDDDEDVDNIHVVLDGFYSKQICTLPYLVQLNRECADDFECAVMFVFAHGGAADKFHKEPAFLNFSAHDDPPTVYASRVGQDGLCLPDVLTHAKLVILCCCHGDELLPAYFEAQGNDIPDICFYDCPILHSVTHAIFVAWLIKTMDCNRLLKRNPDLQTLYLGGREAVRSILYQIKQCDEAEDLWEHLLDWGCISSYAQEKAGQGFAAQWDARCYRIFGCTNKLNLEGYKGVIFREFQALTLVSPGPVEPVRLTHRSEFAKDEQMHPRTRKADVPTTHDNTPHTPHTPTDVAALLGKLHLFIQ
jgi:hypothetical protein